ncbi:DUF397 domain-containing protein [Streptosporangium pseudovulgare]
MLSSIDSPFSSSWNLKVKLEKAQCVEVAQSDACPTVPVRDSKNPTGPVVTIGADACEQPSPAPRGGGASNLVTGPRNWSR